MEQPARHLMVAVGLAVLVFLAEAVAAAVMHPEQLKTEARLLVTELGVVVAVVMEMEGTGLMAICGLLTGALTDGNF